VLAAVAIGGGDRGAALQQIIEAGEVINRAIFTPQELRRGLAKLAHEGYVRAEEGSFVVAGAAKAAFDALPRTTRSSYDLMQFFEDFLQALPYPAVDPETDDAKWSLAGVTDASVTAAADGYHADYEELFAEAKRL
jgi:hypothetical protein